MSLQSVSGLSFEFGGLRSVEIEVSDAPLTSDAGLLPVRQFDECLGFTRRFADALVDERDSDGVRHSWLSMVRQRVYGMLAGYEDQNDHDTLRHDPVFQLICDRVPDDGTGPARSTLASQPTLSRFENSIRIADLWRLRRVLIEQCAGRSVPSIVRLAPGADHAGPGRLRRPVSRSAADGDVPRVLRAVPVPADRDHVRRERRGRAGGVAVRDVRRVSRRGR